MTGKAKAQIDQLRASFWYWALREAVTQEAGDKRSDEALARFLRDKLLVSTALVNPKQLGRYRRGDKNPSKQTLAYAEGLYPGTRVFFDSGPWFSYLWAALDPRVHPQEAITRIETAWRNGVPVEHEMLIGDKHSIQDLLVPEQLAARWNLVPGERLNLTEKCRRWECLNDLCAQLIPPGSFEPHTGGGLLTLAPSVSFTKEERLKTTLKVRLPFFARLSYQIAQARIKGGNSLVLNGAAEPLNTRLTGRLLMELVAKLPDAAGFKIILEEPAIALALPSSMYKQRTLAAVETEELT